MAEASEPTPTESEPTEPAKPRRRARRMIFSVLRVVLLAYVGLCVVMYLFQERMLYLPSGKPVPTPQQAFGLAFDDLTLTADDGVRIHAWFVPADQPRGTILYCHGNAGNIAHRLPLIELYHQLGYNVMMFDYRGYGNSEGTPSEEGTYKDALAAWTYLVEDRGIDPSTIAVSGRSLGGAVATWLAVKANPGALVLESTFTSLNDAAGRVYWFLPVRLLSKFDYNSLARIGTVRCPILVMHGHGDELVPYELGQKLYEAAPEPKRFVELPGSHNQGFFEDGPYRDELAAFLREHLK